MLVDRTGVAALSIPPGPLELTVTGDGYLPSTLMLPGIDSGIQHEEQLVIAAKEGVLVDCVVATVDFGIERLGRNHQAFMDRWYLEVDHNLEILRQVRRSYLSLLWGNVLPLDLELYELARYRQLKAPVRIADRL